MPPTGKLPDEKIAAFEKWIAAGAPDDAPATANATPAPKRGMPIEAGRQWWAFQPVAPQPQPKFKDPAFARRWTRVTIDGFILAKLEQNRLQPSPEADRATLIQRASLDLTGLRPSYDEVQRFIADNDPKAYEKLIDRLLASPQYGERWRRYWLDVARYGEDNPTAEATNPAYPFAWRYRDWVIEALNKDVPYDQFVKLQLAADLAADLAPNTPRDDLRALGYLGAAPIWQGAQCDVPFRPSAGTVPAGPCGEASGHQRTRRVGRGALAVGPRGRSHAELSVRPGDRSGGCGRSQQSWLDAGTPRTHRRSRTALCTRFGARP
jgi:hypothetical protein